MADGKFFHSKKFDDCEQLPESYGITNITLIARDPHSIYAYWEITSNSLSKVKGKLGNSQSLSIRFYDVSLIEFNGNNANTSFDIDIDKHSGSRYINLWADNVSYCADIGVKTSDGNFFTLARSNVIATQRREWVNNFETTWGEVTFDKKGQPLFIPNINSTSKIRTDKKSNDFYLKNQKELEAHHSWQNLPSDLIEKTHKARKRRKPLSANEILAYYARLFPRLRKIKPKLIERLRREGLWCEPLETTVNDFLPKSNITPFAKALFFKPTRFGSTSDFPVNIGGSENSNLGGASESIGASELSYRKRRFFFELHTELIVYGRTEPDADVFLGNERITLNPDGTFSIRFALPDKNIPLDFIAKSADKIEKRRITTAVERYKTIYQTQILSE